MRAGIVWWLEVVGTMGQTMMGDFGTRYMLNQRDDMTV